MSPAPEQKIACPRTGRRYRTNRFGLYYLSNPRPRVEGNIISDSRLSPWWRWLSAPFTVGRVDQSTCRLSFKDGRGLPSDCDISTGLLTVHYRQIAALVRRAGLPLAYPLANQGKLALADYILLQLREAERQSVEQLFRKAREAVDA